MKKKSVSLDVFEESVLPMLQQKHADAKELQKAIDGEYEIYELADDGAKTAVKFTVSASGKAAKADANDAAAAAAPAQIDQKGIAKLVSETVAETMKAFAAENAKSNKGVNFNTIEVGQPSFMPEGLKMYGSVKSFTGTNAEKKRKAYMFGAWLLGGPFGHAAYAEKCKEMGLLIKQAPKTDDAPTIMIGKAHNEGTNTTGGVLVPDQIENEIIDLREKYGKFRAYARMRPMVRDTLLVPRRTAGLTGYFTAEAGAITESTKSWDNVSLTAKKLAALAKYSSEVLEDAIISIADDLADEIVYAFSLKEDQCGFVGDATSTYGGMTGVVTRLTNVWTSTSTTAAGSVIATGNTFAEVTDADLMQVMGSLPEFADDGSAAWYCSRVAAFSVFARLLRASGGVTAAEAAGALPLAYGGYPIVTTQVMPRTDTNSQVIAVFGSLKKSSDFGDRRQTTISVSDQRYWDNDQVGIRGTERFDINNHDVGDGTNAGPVIALRASAS